MPIIIPHLMTDPAKPALLKGSRVAGEKYRDLKQEVKKNVEEFKKEK